MPVINQKELREAIFGSRIAMHYRDVAAAADAIAKYVGQDTLPPKEGATMREYLFASFNEFSHPEVAAALTVIQIEGALGPFHAVVRDTDLTALFSPPIVDAMCARFPAMTRERVARAAYSTEFTL